MPKTQREQLLVFVGVLAFLGAAAYWYLVYAPQSAAMVTTAAKVDTLEANLIKLKAAVGRNSTTQLKEQSRQYAANLQVMRQLVPTANEVTTLVDQISTAARRAGLDIAKLEPLGPEIGTDYDAYRYKLMINGNYHEIAEFVTNVGSLPRIVVPVGLIIGAVPPQQAATSKKSSQAIIDLHTYVAHTAPAPVVEKKGN